jgi:hypothetical protein
VSLSVKKTWNELLFPWTEKQSVSVDIQNGIIIGAELTEDTRDLLEQWPIFLFLKGIGCQKIHFEMGCHEVLGLWVQRMSEYQQEFIQDPENFSTLDHFWDEKSSDSSSHFIRCEFVSSTANRKSIHLGPVPALEAPLGIPEEAARKFVEEIEIQSAKETLHRILLILKEYEREARSKNLAVWANLVADVLTISLQSHLLDKSIQVARDHQETLKEIWTHSDKAIQIFSAYDPKAAEISQWASLFETCPTENLLQYLENHLSSVSGPQMLKLMNYGAQNHSDELIEICLSESGIFKRQLLQWLAPYWRQKHYKRVLENFRASLRDSVPDQELIRRWVSALLRSSRREAFEDLKFIFKPRTLFWKKTNVSVELQRDIILILSEDRNSETYTFLKEIRPFVKGEISNRIEELLQHFKSTS